MKRALLITTLLTISPMTMAEKGDTQRASNTIERLAREEIIKRVESPIKRGLLTKASKLIGKSSEEPSLEMKSLGALIKTVESVVEPSVVIETTDTKLKIKLLKFKNLKLDYTNKNQNLNLKFETDLKTTKLGFSLNF